MNWSGAKWENQGSIVLGAILKLIHQKLSLGNVRSPNDWINFFCSHNRWNGPWLGGGSGMITLRKSWRMLGILLVPLKTPGQLFLSTRKKAQFFLAREGRNFLSWGTETMPHDSVMNEMYQDLISFSCKYSSMLLVVDTRVHSTHVEKCLFCHFGVCKLH